MLAFDSDLAPVVGQQMTLDHHQRGASSARASTLLQRAAPTDSSVRTSATWS